MSRIERIELWHVSVPLKKPFWPSWIPGYPQTHVRYTLARLHADDGRVGITAGNAFSTERKGLGDLLGGYLLGVSADDIPTARQRIREASYLGWRNWWLEAAFWDLKAQGEGRPVYRLLQAKDETVLKAPVYASSGEVRPMATRGPWLDDVRARGIRAVKIRVKDPARRDDVTILREVRREVGEGFVVAVDANQGWPVSLIAPTPLWDLDYATSFGKACDDLGIAWIEEPLDMHDWDGMAELRRRIRTPLAGAELLGDWHEVRAVIERDCLGRYQPDCTFCGGYETARRVMAECRARGLDYSPHTWTNGIGLLINLHAFAAWERRDWLEFPYEPPGWVPAQRDGVIEPIEVNPDGTLDVPQGPGLGIRIDERALRRFGKCFSVVTPFRLAMRTVREKGLGTALALKRTREASR